MRDTLTVNAGSTSIKVTRFGPTSPAGTSQTLDEAFADPRPLDLIVHRVVHGGARTAPEELDDAALRELRGLTHLAPLHQPPALDAIDKCRHRWPDAVHVACFDTAFHATIPAAARTYALPEQWRDTVRVYGFHGLSHAWSAGQVTAAGPGLSRVLIAHLGGGASLCAVRDGGSVATTMGFTPLDGLVMATRTGTLDPGAVLWLAAHTDDDLETLLDKRSGLLGLAGTGDMRQIVERSESGDPAARLALDVWEHRFVREAGGLIAVLGGLDALVFTGGMGENSAAIRERVSRGLRWFGLRVGNAPVDPSAPITEITGTDATVRSFVVPAREDLQMLHEAERLLG